MLSLRRHGAALLLALALAGCAGVSRHAEEAVLERPDVGQVVEFEFTGRISVRQGDTHHAANLSWQHGLAYDEILLSSPLGQGLAQLSRDASGARLITADQQRLEAADWESLATQALGAELPVAQLPRWLVADAPPGARRDAAGRPASFRQDGWSVQYQSYQSESALALPRLIVVGRDDIEVRLKIDAWQRLR